MLNLKKIIVLIITLLFCTSVVFATDIDMNLTSGNVAANDVNNETTNEIAGNGTATNNIDTTNTVAGGSSNTVSNSNTLSGTNAETNANVQSVNNINDVNTSTLEINQILNIFLIAIGLILVLLAIAILIRLRK